MGDFRLVCHLVSAWVLMTGDAGIRSAPLHWHATPCCHGNQDHVRHSTRFYKKPDERSWRGDKFEGFVFSFLASLVLSFILKKKRGGGRKKTLKFFFHKNSAKKCLRMILVHSPSCVDDWISLLVHLWQGFLHGAMKSNWCEVCFHGNMKLPGMRPDFSLCVYVSIGTWPI